MGGNVNAVPPPHTATVGWSLGSSRRNTEFLWSVDAAGLEPGGLTLTLTVRDCPASAAEWKRAREALFQWLRRQGLVRLHWVTEWQRRGVPHLHLALWFGQGLGVHAEVILAKWLDLTATWRASRLAQHWAELYDATGWGLYVSKHAARGAVHYQRSREHLPESWQSGTGRLWGYLGQWPRRDAWKVDVDRQSFYRLRRLLRSRRVAMARACPRAEDRGPLIRWSRGMLRNPDAVASAHRGLGEWFEESWSLQSLRWVSELGGRVESR
jgi:hypothetical protein